MCTAALQGGRAATSRGARGGGDSVAPGAAQAEKEDPAPGHPLNFFVVFFFFVFFVFFVFFLFFFGFFLVFFGKKKTANPRFLCVSIFS